MNNHSTSLKPTITLSQLSHVTNIPELFKSTFIEHYNNRDTYLCCHEVCRRLYGENHTKSNRDQLIRSIGKLNTELYHTYENLECQCDAGVPPPTQANVKKITRTSYTQKHVLISYNAFKKLSAKINEEIYDYYIILENIVFTMINNQVSTMTNQLSTIQSELSTIKRQNEEESKRQCLLYKFMHDDQPVYIGKCANKKDINQRLKKHFKDASLLKHFGISRIAAYLHANNQYDQESGPIQVSTTLHNKDDIDLVEKTHIAKYKPLCNTIHKNAGDTVAVLDC